MVALFLKKNMTSYMVDNSTTKVKIDGNIYMRREEETHERVSRIIKFRREEKDE
jgi:hypothetical protein